VDVSWDPAKAEENLRKHGIAFDDVGPVFDDPLMVTIADGSVSFEERFFGIGEMKRGRLVAVWFTIIDDHPHLIGARHPQPAERRRYMRGDQIRDEPPLDEMPDEIDFSNGVRGRFYSHDIRIRVWLDPDVRRVFPTEKAVNDALRALAAERAMHEVKR